MDLSFFEKLFCRDTSITIHQRNDREPATEILKIYKSLFPDIMQDILHNRNVACNPNKSIFTQEELQNQCDMVLILFHK